MVEADNKFFNGKASCTLAEWISGHSKTILGREISPSAAPLLSRKDMLKLFESYEPGSYFNTIEEILKGP